MAIPSIPLDSAAFSQTAKQGLLPLRPAQVDRVCGDRTPTVEDMRALRYTTRVINESQRLYPQPPVLIRRALEPDTLGGYEVPAGSDIFIATWNMHRSAELWERPEEFDPDRFGPLDGPVPNEITEDFKYLPFGGGKRKCIGARANGRAGCCGSVLLGGARQCVGGAGGQACTCRGGWAGMHAQPAWAPALAKLLGLQAGLGWCNRRPEALAGRVVWYLGAHCGKAEKTSGSCQIRPEENSPALAGVVSSPEEPPWWGWCLYLVGWPGPRGPWPATVDGPHMPSALQSTPEPRLLTDKEVCLPGYP
jgi:hypothetical protein